MDFSRLQQLGPDFLALNASTSSLPSTFLESFVPGYGVISQIILRFFGIDIGLLASGLVVLFGLSHAFSFCNSYLSSYFDLYFTSSISIDGEDELYKNVVSWVTQQRMTAISRDLRALTKARNNSHDSDDDDSDHEDDFASDDGIFNYGRWASNVPPRYEPNYGLDKFVFEGRTFFLTRERKDKKNAWWGDQYEECITLRCVGRSTQPIKDLLVHIKQWVLKNEDQTTSIYRPQPKNENGGDAAWDRQSNRASRPMRTVSLDREQKRTIVSDINEYLQPETRRWYDARGIPYRRGYLFHGPPGTGKTSLSFALAGIFGLHIYCISLSEVGLTEADLNKLFMELPRRCIVLLEDIDSAGLRRENDPIPEPTSPTGPGMPKAATDTPGPRKSLISLAGLLNVIDGVASHEGRVLIMTSNHPENLDEALTRPGRVDIRIPFSLATHTQIKDIFIRMYGKDAQKPKDTNQSRLSYSPPSRSVKSANGNDEEDDDDIEDLLFQKPTAQTVNKDTLRTMAQTFADNLPEDRFSPAAIQGYLLTRKREPRRALDEVCAWRDEQLKAMEEKKK